MGPMRATQPPPQELQLLKPGQVCEMLGVSYDGLNRMVSAGALPETRVPGLGWRRFLRSDVERLLNPDRATVS